MFKVFKTTGIEANYSISANAQFVTNNSWTIYPARHKTTKKKCSVWQFDKKECENSLTKSGLLYKGNKNLVLEDIYDSLKKYIANLAKFRHPNILTIIEPLEDHKNRILFVTEYVVNDLRSMDKDNIREIMISKGLLQIATGLKFLHQSVSCVHLNINPSSIFINENFDWKISGLQFIENLENGIREHYVNPSDNRMPSFINLDFKYTSPNLMLKHNLDYIDDLFSLGCLIYYLFNNGKHLIACPNDSTTEYERAYNKVMQVVKAPNVRNHALFSKIPQNYFDMFIRLITETESNTDVIQLRTPLTIDNLINSSLFNNELVKILNVIDEFPTLSTNEKINFLKNLKPVLNEFPEILIINKFIPILLSIINVYLNKTQGKSKKKKSGLEKLELDDEQLITLTVDNLLALSNQISVLTFSDQIYPVILSILQQLDILSFKSVLVSNLSTIESRLGANVNDLTTKQSQRFSSLLLTIFEQSIVPANNNPSLIVLQEHILNNLLIFISYQNYTVITHKIFESLGGLYSSTTSLKIKNLTIKSFILMINNDKHQDKNLDNYIIIEKLLPLIQNTSISNFKNPVLLVNLIDLYRSLFEKLSSSTKSSITTSTKDERSIFDIILESIFFELWKLSRYIVSEKDLALTFNTLDKIQAYLKKKTTDDVHNREKSGINDVVNGSDRLSSPSLAATSEFQQQQHQYQNYQGTNGNDNDDDDDDEFGEFTSNAKEAKPMQLQQEKRKNFSFGQTTESPAMSPSPVASPAPVPVTQTSTNSASHRVGYPVMTKTGNHAPVSTTTSAPIHRPMNTNSQFQTMAPTSRTLSPMPATTTTSTSTIQPHNTQSTAQSAGGSIDWSNASASIKATSTPMNQLNMQTTSGNSSPNANLFTVIQPTKKLYQSGNGPTQSSYTSVNTNTNNDTAGTTVKERDFFESLI